jgi:hypothetical protein
VGLAAAPVFSAVDVRQGEYAFSDLLSWNRVLLGDLLNIDGFLSIDADERINRVRITVDGGPAADAVAGVVQATGIPSRAVQIETGTRMHALQTNLFSRVRPTGSSMEIENAAQARCTLGWNVTSSLSENGFLTAGHCSRHATGGGMTGETMYQANVTANDNAGAVLLNFPWNRACSDPDTGQPYSGRCTLADAMFVQSSVGAKRVGRTTLLAVNNARGTRNFGGWYNNIGGIGFALVGLNADKVGRTSGWTRGMIAGSCVTHRVQDSPTTEYLITCAYRITGAGVGEGDSGGPVFNSVPDHLGSVINPLGITFAGGPLNRIDINDGGVRFCDANCTLLFSEWQSINFQLQRYFDPTTL